MISKQKWNIEKVASRIDKKIDKDMDKIVKAIYSKCLAFAKTAKSSHTYKNYKGELESSVGVVVLKDRNEIKEWNSTAATGTDPSRGISDFNDVLSSYIIGKDMLPDGTYIPEQSIAGIVFAAAPYASMIENGQNEFESALGISGFGGKKVLNAFAPSASDIFTVLKVIIG